MKKKKKKEKEKIKLQIKSNSTSSFCHLRYTPMAYCYRNSCLPYKHCLPRLFSWVRAKSEFGFRLQSGKQNIDGNSDDLDLDGPVATLHTAILKLTKCQETVLTVHVWAASWRNNKMACAPTEVSDQPEHSPRPIRVFAVRMKKPWVLIYSWSAQRRVWSDWADAQADLRLRWAHR